MSSITLSTNERVFITGKTGSGKTFLARYLTRKIKRLVVLDGKGTLGTPDWALEPFEQNIEKLNSKEPFRLRAVPGLKTDLTAYWDDVLETTLRAGNVTIYIDELYAVVPPNKTASPTLFGCYTRGREFGVGVWASTQRPVWIPLVAMSEAEHFFMFRLQLMEDKQRLAAFMGADVLQPIYDEHGFYYAKAADDYVRYYHQFQPQEKEAAVTNTQRDELPEMPHNRKRQIFTFR